MAPVASAGRMTSTHELGTRGTEQERIGDRGPVDHPCAQQDVPERLAQGRTTRLTDGHDRPTRRRGAGRQGRGRP